MLSTGSTVGLGAAVPEPSGTREAIPWRVLDLGLTPYGVALERQAALVEERIRGRIPDTLIPRRS